MAVDRKPIVFDASNRVSEHLATEFLNHGLGSLGAVKDHGDITSGVNLDSAQNGLFHRMRLTSGSSFVFSNSLPLANGAGWIIVDNQTGAEVTPTWPGHFEFGAAGAPIIPDNTVCTILTAYDYEGGVFRCVHNTTTSGGIVVKTPNCTFTNGDLVLSGSRVADVPIPYGGTVIGWTIAGDAAGDASIVVSTATYAAYDTMTTLFTATCTAANKAQASGLSIAVVPGVLRFAGSGFASFKRVSITLEVN